MSSRKMRSFYLVFSFVSLSLLSAQQPPGVEAPGRQEVIRTITEVVVLDLVVRNKKGKLILDLTPEEVEVYEDGARRVLTSFRLVTGSAAAGLGSTAPTSGPEALDPMRHLRLVSLVYEGLDNQARRLARRASLDFLKNDLEQNLYVAVFVISDRLRVLQPFTNDLGRLRRAVERATTSDYPQFVAESEAIRRQLEVIQREGAAATQVGAMSLPGPGQTDSSGIAGASTSAMLAQITLNMLNFAESLTRTQQARSTLFSLLSLVKEQAVLPGRKTVVYFTRGIQVPENMVEQFHSTISMANRAGVSIYGVDARGLILDSQNSANSSMLSSAALASRRQQTVDGAAVTPEQVKIFDTAMSSIHANTQQALEALSLSTGGFLVANTNDLRQSLQQIREEVLTYYEVSFVPLITEYDGRFHKLTVKVNRPDVKVQARNGFFALPPNQDSIFTYEVPLFHALNQSPPPTTLPYHVAAIPFGRYEGKTRYCIIIEVPLRELKATEDKENNHYNTRLSVLALLKDSRDWIVERISHDFPFQVPNDRLEEFQKRHFLHTTVVEIPLGRYTLESAVMDREGQRTSAKRVSVMVLQPEQGVEISGISLVRRVDPQSAETGAGDPFHVQGNKIVPTLENSVRLVAGGGFSFYFVIYPSAGEASRPQLTLELWRDGARLGSVNPELPEVNEHGEIPYIASFPIEKFTPGDYVLRAIARQGSFAAEEKTVFTISP